MDGRTDFHLIETLHNRLNAVTDKHDIVGSRFRLWANETTAQGRQHDTTHGQTGLNMCSRLTSGEIGRCVAFSLSVSPDFLQTRVSFWSFWSIGIF